jgi:cellulose synthase/poly-beta-1,6-N-acetylglucosamine synthase-like glycosyltransferase
VVPYEIVVVDNASSDGTKEWLIEQEEVEYTLSGPSEKSKFKAILNPTNEGVIARNKGFAVSSGEIIAQIDDDVTVHKNWDIIALHEFEDEKVGMCGVQGGLIRTWMDYEVFQSNNGYVDFLTGFFMCFRNVGLVFDEKLGAFWEEDSDLSFQFKYNGYKLRTIPMVCTHVSLRNTPINWDLHNGNRQYVKNKWADKLEKLRLGGN